MGRYRVLAVKTKYWRPRENYLKEIVEAIKREISDRDFLVISEKAISTATNNIVDENSIEPSLNAEVIAKFWMRMVWGYFLGPLCHFHNKLLRALRSYPFDVGSRHKQVALQYAGLFQALMFGSEGGIDGSNLAYSYVSLPLRKPGEEAERIREQIWLKLGHRVFVLIVDTDKTYSFKNFHLTPHPNPIDGIHSFGGFVTYVVSRMLRLRKRATPIAVAGCRMSAEEALKIANIANRARSFGAGKTVWQMATKFNTGLADVSWEMLETVKHKPIVIVRRQKGEDD